ncbi:MAG: phosphoglycerate kinase [Patescibacteria group bacterium]|jgi:phosphoglycerate kinase
MKSVRQIKNLTGKKVLVRVDFNVSIHKGKVVSDYKLSRSLPTIEYLLNQGARVVLVSHLGRPNGIDSKHSLKPVVHRLEDLLQRKVKLLPITKGQDWRNTQAAVSAMPNGSVAMLENIRFLKDEETEGQHLSKVLASLCDIFVLDGFAVAHRRAASVSGVAKYVPSYAGLLLFEEITVLSNVLRRPKRPLLVMLGGAKAETKIPVLKKLLPIADYILVGGGIFNTYLASLKKPIGKSIYSKGLEKEVKRYCENRKVILPVDVIVGDAKGNKVRVVKVSELSVGKNEAIYDIGPESVHLFAKYLKKAKTLVWNGALGMFEQHPYQYGTFSLARLFAARSKGHALGVCGGGETVQILEKIRAMTDIDLVSTGGGAMLEFLSGDKLPGLKALK